MKKKNLSSLALKKNSISSLNFVNSIKGRGEENEAHTTACVETEMTNCETCATQGDITGCITNDATRSLRPTDGLACNGLNTGELC